MVHFYTALWYIFGLHLTIINLKPQELENFKLMAQSNPDIFNNLMAVVEMQSNTTHTSNNTVFGLHDDAYLGGLVDSYSKYFQSGEFIFDFLPVGVASKVVKTNTNLSTKVVDDVGLKLPTNYYPSNNGFIGEIDRVYLMPKTLIDRYGKNTGSYVSPIGTPFEMRALPNEAKNLEYKVYEVIKPIEVNAGMINPAFGNMGLGIQYKLPKNLKILEEKGFIKNVE